MKSSLILCLSASLASMAASYAAVGVFTEFEIPSGSPNVATFTLSTYGLYSIDQLSAPGDNLQNVAYAYFTPSASGTYTIGISTASFDPVLIVYQGQSTFPSLSPGDGAIAFNDDGNVTSFEGIAFTNSSAPASFNPLIRDLSLTAGTDYLVAVTSWAPNEEIPLPLKFFVYGSEQVAVNGEVIPETSTAMLCGLSVIPLLRRKRK